MSAPTTRFLGLTLLTLALASAACEDKSPQPPLAPPKQANTPSTPPGATAPTQGTAPAARGGSAAVASSTAEANVSALGVTLTLPPGWKQRPPASQMRLAEAEVADASGDAAKSCLVVFSTAGGTVADNIARWSGQVHDAKGQPVTARPETRTVSGMSVTIVELAGSFAGMGDAAPKANWLLRGAIIETTEGLLFIKMTGPAASMAAAADGFTALVNSVKKP